MSEETSCIVCGEASAGAEVLIGGQAFGLCPAHEAQRDAKAPTSFEDLAAFFERSGLERRLSVDRRHGERRVFPPRPELRRKNQGRRRDDPRY
ncbi:MAG: hypothetical protein FJ096_13760 [Deltaproteobacteria bacterium]|nr:hypothetical protein [Deltaproteobacteria bacterium]